MKKLVIFVLATGILLCSGFVASAQLGGLMNKVKNKMVEKVLGVEQEGSQGEGGSGSVSNCASDDDPVVFEFGKGFKVAANEVSIHIRDGNILLYHKAEGKYYIRRGNSGATEGPFKGDDPAVKGFGSLNAGGTMSEDELLVTYPQYISRSGEALTIRAGGKSYGPYAGIHSFVLNDAATEFAALVVTEVYKEDPGMAELARKMEQAKTDQEKMAIAMANQEKMAAEAMKIANMDMTPKLVTNVAGASEEVPMGAELSSTIKRNMIVWVTLNGITDLAGNKIFDKANLTGYYDMQNFWLSSDNKIFCSYDNGTLKFSDGRECNGIFSPYREVVDGREVISFFYFSPQRNAILKSSHPF